MAVAGVVTVLCVLAMPWCCVLGMHCAVSDAHDDAVLSGGALLAQYEMQARQQLQGMPSLEAVLFPTLQPSSTLSMASFCEPHGSLEEVTLWIPTC